jgi:putative endonuclease
MKLWFVYIVACSDGSLYTGITTDLARRVREHNEGPKGARYTRSKRPVVLQYSAEFANRSEASKAEFRIKKLTREQKERMIEDGSSGVHSSQPAAAGAPSK